MNSIVFFVYFDIYWKPRRYRGNIVRFRICCCWHVMKTSFFNEKKNLGKHGVSNPKGKKRGDIGQDSIQLNQFFHRVWLTNKTHRSSVGGKMSVGFHNIDFLCSVMGTTIIYLLNSKCAAQSNFYLKSSAFNVKKWLQDINLQIRFFFRFRINRYRCSNRKIEFLKLLSVLW